MEITQSEFQEWRRNPVTKAVFEAIQKECFQLAESLARTAGLDSIQDRYVVGVIRGMERLLEVDFEEQQIANSTEL